MTAEQTAHLHRTAVTGAPVSFHGTDSTAAAVVEHLCWLQTSAAEASSLKPEPPGPLWQIIRSTGWPSARAKAIADGSCGTHILPPQSDLSLLRAIESDLRARIASTGFSASSAKAFTGAVTEIINNIWEHSQADSPALLVYRLESQRVHIAIADLGVGVLQSLQTNPRYHALTSSMTALKKAMEIGVSRLDGRSRGYGFATILSAVADQWGGIRLRTGEAILTIHGLESLRQEVASYGVPLPGLQIAFSCGVENETAKKILGSYNEFIGMLADEKIRSHLEELTEENADNDSVHQRARQLSHTFRDGLLEFFFDPKSELEVLTKNYGVF